MSVVTMPTAVANATPLYPPIEPYKTGFLKVSPLHTIYYEVCGNPAGQPVVYLHGGPGGGISPDDRRYFDPSYYRIVLFDQRGAGKSTPHACLEDNNTWALVSDIEKLRTTLGIDRWVVFGGSWGSTLALSYAETYPDIVQALVLRGIFLLRRSELLWFYQDGASHMYPEYWEPYWNAIPEGERGDMISAYYRRLTGNNTAEQMACAKAWSTWECATSKLYVDPVHVAKAADDQWALAFARIECHYFVNAGFFKTDGQLLRDVGKIRHIPTTIVQGHYDLVCPMRSAWDLHKAFPESELIVISDAGHSAKEPGITSQLVQACNKYRDRFLAQQDAPSRRESHPPAGKLSSHINYPATRYETPSTPSSAASAQSEPDDHLPGVMHRKKLQPPGGKSTIIFG